MYIARYMHIFHLLETLTLDLAYLITCRLVKLPLHFFLCKYAFYVDAHAIETLLMTFRKIKLIIAKDIKTL